jgi:hypothetical protein
VVQLVVSTDACTSGVGGDFAAARPTANKAHHTPRTGTTKNQSVQSICCLSASVNVKSLFCASPLFPPFAKKIGE